jgi:hypothetical protein
VVLEKPVQVLAGVDVESDLMVGAFDLGAPWRFVNTDGFGAVRVGAALSDFGSCGSRGRKSAGEGVRCVTRQSTRGWLGVWFRRRRRDGGVSCTVVIVVSFFLVGAGHEFGEIVLV